MEIISGTALSKIVKNSLAERIAAWKAEGKRAPKLSVVLVGEDSDSMKYVKIKEKTCAEIGMIGELHLLPENISQGELLGLIDKLNRNEMVDGILIQLPLPAHIDTKTVLNHVDYRKDADGLHPMNAGLLFEGGKGVLPCTPKGIISLLKYGNIEIDGKHAVVLGRSNLVGNPVAQMLMRENATVTICHTHTQNLPNIVKQADILVLAMGTFGVVTPEMLKPDVVVVDVAMNWVNNRLAGDLYAERNLAALENIVSVITPVPGGVGPMTIVGLLENVVEMATSQPHSPK
ncbi:MAG: bifunctional 5,10-methylenetetrahydrofolate dehydrogenase/5,10-methenyltetrahydrofolate cyclohydrolase [Bacteroidales bacterium]|jgi:methylenetetrahydrofolate dehydrogenase (NADP+)/methenyltetrahydrofolate cyclohydrolase|nr:bifunctional 5,10-methylenetetrahydrofolate dehydrogenase/5,10-methenyltetrahydrofolate cyclohydrolase [Bacteroidales bacterium]